jgi:hypothetical protein
MDLGEFEDYCNSNLWNRTSEISVLKQILEKKDNSSKERKILTKSFIIFLYSNWQGFIDEISKKYLEFVNQECSKWICLLDTKFHTWNLKIDTLQNQYFKRLNIDYNSFKTKCYTELRFNLTDLQKINWWKNIKLTKNNNFHDNFCYIINDLLVWNRNDIAHWKNNVLPAIDELNILSDFIFKILNKYKEYLYKNLEDKTYLIIKIK